MVFRIVIFVMVIKFLSTNNLINPILSTHDLIWNNVKEYIAELGEAD